MNVNQLYYKYDINGEPIYYHDEKCTKPFTGHIEDYDRGFMCMESDVIEGKV